MRSETITDTPTLLIRRMVLAPGDATPWHRDACRRFTVVVRGSRLAIEYRDAGERSEFDVPTGTADWDDPQPRAHRAINVGTGEYEEVVTFYRSAAGQEPQPTADTVG